MPQCLTFPSEVVALQNASLWQRKHSMFAISQHIPTLQTRKTASEVEILMIRIIPCLWWWEIRVAFWMFWFSSRCREMQVSGKETLSVCNTSNANQSCNSVSPILHTSCLRWQINGKPAGFSMSQCLKTLLASYPSRRRRTDAHSRQRNFSVTGNRVTSPTWGPMRDSNSSPIICIPSCETQMSYYPQNPTLDSRSCDLTTHTSFVRERCGTGSWRKWECGILLSWKKRERERLSL